MLGYIVPDKPELKMREYELYRGYYCGICKSIGQRYGHLPRLTLHYDSVFLAMLLSSLSTELEQISLERCIVHPLKKRLIVENETACDYAADMLLILAYFKFRDDFLDEKKWRGRIGSALMRSTYHQLQTLYPALSATIKDKLEELSELENSGCNSMDRAAEPFAKLMEEVFAGYPFQKDLGLETKTVLRSIGYHVGKWVYLIDSIDDLEENESTGAYNPLLIQFREQKNNITIAEWKQTIADRVEFNLTCCLAELAEQVKKLPIQKNADIIDNFIYLGLLKQTEQIVEKGRKAENAKSI